MAEGRRPVPGDGRGMVVSLRGGRGERGVAVGARAWGSKRPEGDVFTREVKIKAVENMDIVAEASCNVHGSAGPATAKIAVRD